MTTLRRLYYEYSTYHIISRGNNRQNILQNHEDKLSFLESLSNYKLRYSFKLFAFVLMDNHFHLIIETNPAHNISRVMQGILLSYSNKFRRKYCYVGHVWQGRFFSKVIQSEPQVIQNIEYIHNNPVRASMVRSCVEFSWSSACYYGGLPNSVIDKLIDINRFGEI